MKMKKITKILLIYTGGTIGMIKNPQTGMLEPFDFHNLMKNVPEINRFDVEVDTISFEPIDSSDISPEKWANLVETIRANYFGYDGFVILHGTDTMSYTASALSFLIENNRKPIILTGSQLPIGQIRTDGKENLITSIEIASTYENGKPVVPEIAICFQNKLFRGNRTHKYNSEYFDAFVSPNYPLLAEIGIDIKYNYKAILRPDLHKPVRFHTKLNNNIATIKLFPGISYDLFHSLLKIPNLQGLIIESYGSGNAPTVKWLEDFLIECRNRKIVVFNVSQCNAGGIKQGVYEASKIFVKTGVVSGKDISYEAAVAKMMFLLSLDMDYEQVKYYLGVNIAGEMTD